MSTRGFLKFKLFSEIQTFDLTGLQTGPAESNRSTNFTRNFKCVFLKPDFFSSFIKPIYLKLPKIHVSGVEYLLNTFCMKECVQFDRI